MNDKIEVGEYVRTYEGDIFEFGGYFKSGMIDSMTDKDGILCGNQEKCCKKHSKNIIDLIEVGDYVNGKEVKHIAMFEGFPDYPKLIFVDEHRLLPDETCENKDIKSIVTKEQFNSVKYVVERE